MKTGRPTKAPDHEKTAVIDRFFIEIAGTDPKKMQSHNIYSQLESFAWEIGYRTPSGQTLVANDFRSAAMKKYIGDLASTGEDVSLNGSIPAFQRLDINSLLGKPIVSMKRILTERERYLETTYLKAAKALEKYAAMHNTIEAQTKEISRLSAEEKRLRSDCEQLEGRNKELKKQVEYLTRTIKRRVEPEMAKAYLDGLPKRGMPTEKLEKMVHTPISALVADDMADRAAVNNVITLDFEKLF